MEQKIVTRANKEIKYLFMILMIVVSLTLIFNNNPFESNMNTFEDDLKEISFGKESINEELARYKLQYSSYFGGSVFEEYGEK